MTYYHFPPPLALAGTVLKCPLYAQLCVFTYSLRGKSLACTPMPAALIIISPMASSPDRSSLCSLV